MPEQFLAVQGATVTFGRYAASVRALRGVSLSIVSGSLTLVMGPSGSGKTTLLSLLGCLLSPQQGSVFVDGVDVSNLDEKDRTVVRQQKIGFVFQAFRLLHSLSAVENVELALQIRATTPSPAQRHAARELLQQFGLGDKLNCQPEQLSHGEKQRVAIARALVGNPAIILADEPTASLDAEAGKSICQILRAQSGQNGRTIVVVSHDPRWQEFADRTITLRDGEVEGDVNKPWQA